MATPPELLAAVRRRFGRLAWDLAANGDNSVTGKNRYFGPGAEFPDALKIRWPNLSDWCWLNPPYATIAPWAEKCAAESARGCRVLLLVPAAVGADWFNEHVRRYAYVLELTPRVRFVGHEHAYPKDLILCAYCPERLVGRASWRWDDK